MVLGQCIEGLRNSRKSSSSSHGSGIVIPFRQNKLTEMLFGNAILKKDTRAVMIVNLSRTTAYEENVGILRYASLAHEIEALPASELGGSMSRSPSGEVRAEEGTKATLTALTLAEWNEKLAQMEFMLREEECRRLDAEEKLALLEHEMLQQAAEMEEKMAEMERVYMYRLTEENQRSYNHTDAKLDIMAASLQALNIHEDPVIEQKEQLIRDLQDENLSLRQELESLRVGFPDGKRTL